MVLRNTMVHHIFTIYFSNILIIKLLLFVHVMNSGHEFWTQMSRYKFRLNSENLMTIFYYVKLIIDLLSTFICCS
jgi:hypothetical protein